MNQFIYILFHGSSIMITLALICVLWTLHATKVIIFHEFKVVILAFSNYFVSYSATLLVARVQSVE
jgi:hypothetical protein